MVSEYTDDELRGMMSVFVQQSQTVHNQETSLAWHESLLPVWSEPIMNGKHVLVMEMGGSKLRIGVGYVEHKEIHWMAEPVKKYTVNEHADVDAFFDWMVSEVQDVYDEYTPEIFSFIFSYPHSVFGQGNDISGELTQLTKGLHVPGLIGVDLCAEIRRRLPGLEQVVVLNDAAALVLSTYQAELGLIVGTGGNMGAVHPASQYVCNIEAGNFDGVVLSESVRRVDESEHGGRQLLEKSSTGRYLKKLLLIEAELDGWSENRLQVLQRSLDEYGSAMVGRLALGDETGLDLSDAELVYLSKSANGLLVRSAQLWGMAVSSVLQLNQMRGVVQLPVTGGVILGNQRYQEVLRETVVDLVGVDLEIIDVSDPIAGGVVAGSLVSSQSLG